MAAVTSLLRHQVNDEEWVAFVNDAEDSISRERTPVASISILTQAHQTNGPFGT